MRKGQAAMEFLMTYGWAILVVLAAIGALAYFGVLNPGRFLPTKCTVSGGLPCTELEIDGATANGVTIVLQNSLGDAATVSRVDLRLTQPSACAGSMNYTTANITKANGEYYTISPSMWNALGPGCTAANLNGRVKGIISITYQKESDQVPHVLSGDFQGYTNN